MLVCSVLLVGAQTQSEAAVPTNWQQENLVPKTTNSWYWARVVNCNEWISLRAYPSTEAERLVKIPLGATVQIYHGQFGEGRNEVHSPSHGFYLTRYEGMSGWCLIEYISVGERVR